MYLAVCSARLQYSLSSGALKVVFFCFWNIILSRKYDLSVKLNLFGQIVYTKVFALNEVWFDLKALWNRKGGNTGKGSGFLRVSCAYRLDPLPHWDFVLVLFCQISSVMVAVRTWLVFTLLWAAGILEDQALTNTKHETCSALIVNE